MTPAAILQDGWGYADIKCWREMADADEPREIFTRYYPSIVSYLIRRFRFTEDEARDIAQDAFVSVFTRMREHQIDAPWMYLKVSAHHRAVNVIRERVRRRSFETTTLDELPHIAETLVGDFFTGDPPKTPEAEASDRQRAERVREAIDGLNTIYRECLLLWLGGLQYDEIAVSLGVTMDTVRSRLRDAKQKLRDRLGEIPGGREGDDDRKG